ncbi:MAG: hypothetical protein AB7N76_13930 [Planctomycetota bacterium]
MSLRPEDAFAERLPLLIYPGELDAADLAELEAHLLACAACQEVHEELLAIAGQLDLLEDPALSPAERRALLANVLTATGGDPDPDLHAALDLVEEPCLDEARRAHLREGVLARVGLVPAASAEELAPTELQAVGAALDLVEAPALDAAQRRAFREGVLARVQGAAQPESLDVGAALDLVEASALDAAQRRALREGVLARVRGEARPEQLEDLGAALDLVEAPALDAAQRRALREGVLARVRGEARPAQLEDLGAALDLVEAPALDSAQRRALREGVLARVRGEAPQAREVARALDLVPVPAIDRAALREGALRRAGALEPAPEQHAARPAAHPAAQRPAAQRPGRVVAFPAPAAARAPLWGLRAAAGLLIASFLGLGAFGSLRERPAALASADVVALEAASAEAETLGRAIEPNELAEPVLLAGTMERYQRVLDQARSNPGARQLARRVSYQLHALELLQPQSQARASVAVGITQDEPPTVSEDPAEVGSFLISNETVLRDYPDSVASSYVLKRFRVLLGELEHEGRFRFSAVRMTPQLRLAMAQIVPQALGRDPEHYVRNDLKNTFAYDFDKVRQHVPVSITRATKQAWLLQRALHAEELGDLVEARRSYEDVIALDRTSRAATVARERLSRLG